MPWRQPGPAGTYDPYAILVSELMLQQTQVGRVIPKYRVFMERFPDAVSLASAPLADVLRLWSGLGYNRRAKYLWRAAGIIQERWGGVMPAAVEELVALPGVGRNTAGAVVAYAFNKPVVFVETNIRTVFIHHCFPSVSSVDDRQLVPLIAATLPDGSDEHASVREWYWALMDYGAYLKQQIGNVSRRSKQYTRQSPFEGSRRQIRGEVLRLLGQRPLTVAQLRISIEDPRLPEVLDALMAEEMIRLSDGVYCL
ncbi:endonuclease III [Candidatus Saccharibacteria bacterium]|nr:MAG: endonuclease III [Candidatus Saccharibacteria bacterium]